MFAVKIVAVVLGLGAAAIAGAAYHSGFIFNPSPTEPPKERHIYDFTMKNIDGQDVKLDAYKGKVVMIVNVASKCGLRHSMKASRLSTRNTKIAVSRFWASLQIIFSDRSRAPKKRSKTTGATATTARTAGRAATA